MSALQRCESGGESSGEKEGYDKLWDGFQLLGEADISGSIWDFQHLINKSTAKDIPPARDQDAPPIHPDEVQSVTLQNEQQRPALQQPVTTPNYPSQEILSWHTKPSHTLENGRQETICQPRLALSGPSTGTEPQKGRAQTLKKPERERQEGFGAIEGQAEHFINPKKVQSRSDSFSSSAVHSLATGSLRSFRRRKPQPWKDPQQSLGEMIETNDKKIKGKVWVAEGPALELFEAQIRPQIEKLLHNTEPPQCAPLLLALYMIGKTDMSASPIIMMCCRDRKVRKDAEATIRESDILQQFPEMGLGNSATLLETSSFVTPVTGTSTETQMNAPSSSSFEEEHVIGRRLRLINTAEGGKTLRFGTGGPFIRIDKHIYQITAFHFCQENTGTAPVAELDSEPNDCEYDGQSDTEEDESDIEKEATKETPLKESLSASYEAESTHFSMEYQRDVTLDEQDPQDPWKPRALLNRKNIDYDLVRLPAAEASQASNTAGNFANYHSFQVTDICTLPVSRTPVVVVTSHSLLTGAILPGTKRVKMQGFYGFQDLLTARLSCSIKTGDSGSAVFDASTGCFYGHIVLGSAPDTFVYIVPSVNIFTSLVASFGEIPSLNLQGPILNAEIPRGVVYRKEYMGAATDPSYNSNSDLGPQQQQRPWFDHDPAVIGPKGQDILAPSQTPVNWGIPSIEKDDQITWYYDKPMYDFDRHCYYWEGRRHDGSRVRQYPPVGT